MNVQTFHCFLEVFLLWILKKGLSLYLGSLAIKTASVCHSYPHCLNTVLPLEEYCSALLFSSVICTTFVSSVNPFSHERLRPVFQRSDRLLFHIKGLLTFLSLGRKEGRKRKSGNIQQEI